MRQRIYDTLIYEAAYIWYINIYEAAYYVALCLSLTTPAASAITRDFLFKLAD